MKLRRKAVTWGSKGYFVRELVVSRLRRLTESKTKYSINKNKSLGYQKKVRTLLPTYILHFPSRMVKTSNVCCNNVTLNFILPWVFHIILKQSFWLAWNMLFIVQSIFFVICVCFLWRITIDPWWKSTFILSWGCVSVGFWFGNNAEIFFCQKPLYVNQDILL